MPAGRERDLSNDQLAAIAVAAVALTLLWSRRWLLLATVGHWLQLHQITLPPGHGLLVIPYLGGVDLARILAGIAVAGLIGIPAALTVRRRSSQARAERERRLKRPPAAEEFG